MVAMETLFPGADAVADPGMRLEAAIHGLGVPARVTAQGF